MMRGLVPFAVVLLCGSLLSAAGQAPQPPATPSYGLPDGVPADWLPPAPKNLKVLPADITPKDLLAVMKTFSNAMGVRCVYCHVAGSDSSDMSTYNFASDRKEHKETTRAMLKYTDDVNASFPKGVGDEPPAGQQRVTCYTCHQAKRQPPTGPPAPRPAAAPAPKAN